MFCYQPPKSSIWGHSLRKMAPATQRSLFQDFLDRAVAVYQIEPGSLSYFHLQSPNRIAHFEEILGVPSVNGAYYQLTPAQFDRCFRSILADVTLLKGLSLMQAFSITHWSIGGQPAPTTSRFHLYYGLKPCLSTFLQFAKTEHFQYIKQVLMELKLCTLKEIHLRPVRLRGSKGES